jgi:hypothetical protein
MSIDAFGDIVGRLRRPAALLGWMLIALGVTFVSSSGFRLNPLTNLSLPVCRKCLFLIFPFGISLCFLNAIRRIQKAGGLDSESAETMEGWLAVLIVAAYAVILDQW